MLRDRQRSGVLVTDKVPPNQSPFDAYAPAQIAEKVESLGVAKVHLGFLETVLLGVLAGAFISFGAMLFTLVISDSVLGLGPTRLLGGIAFSLGLVLVVIAGAELFTGNNLIVMAWADGRVSTWAMARNWTLVYFGNLIGSLATAVFVWFSGVLDFGPPGASQAVAATAVRIAVDKVTLPPVELLFRGILCNTLVCLAVWLSLAAHTVPGKILAIVFPITAFVALGFEHSVANMYLIPVGFLASQDPNVLVTAAVTETAMAKLTLAGFMRNLVTVTLGNIFGGSCLVALVYYVIYIRPRRRANVPKKPEATKSDGTAKPARTVNGSDTESAKRN